MYTLNQTRLNPVGSSCKGNAYEKKKITTKGANISGFINYLLTKEILLSTLSKVCIYFIMYIITFKLYKTLWTSMQVLIRDTH